MARLLQVIAVVAMGVAFAASADPTPPQKSVFDGNWFCSSRFYRTGIQFSALVSIQTNLQTGVVSVHRDDRWPGTDHTTEMWAPPKEGSGMEAAIVDLAGSVKLFQSAGWQVDRLVWDRTEDDHYREQYDYKLIGMNDLVIGWSEALDQKPLQPTQVSTCRRRLQLMFLQ